MQCGRGVKPRYDVSNTGGVLAILTYSDRGREGVKNNKNLAEVICTCHLSPYLCKRLMGSLNTRINTSDLFHFCAAPIVVLSSSFTPNYPQLPIYLSMDFLHVGKVNRTKRDHLDFLWGPFTNYNSQIITFGACRKVYDCRFFSVIELGCAKFLHA